MDSDRTQILSRIRSAGVVGAGGAGFPTYKKLDASVEHIIANGAECEPLMYKDREVMIQEQERMLAGLSIMKQITGAARVTIAIKRKNSDLMKSLQPAAAKLGFATHVMEDVYPAGDEYILVYDVTGRRIPPGGIPLQIGVVVDNVETIVNVARAAEGVPVTEKYITVTGAVREAVTIVVPVGTSFRECIELAGGITVQNPVVFTGGLMMGGMETDLSLPVTKTVGGLIVLPPDHPLVERKGAPASQYNRIGHSTCDQCSLCTELCPRYILGYPIEPHKVMRSLMMTGAERDRISLWAAYCCECNVCTLFACPEKLDPKNICVDAKGRLREQKISRSKEELDQLFRDVHSAREGRQIPIAMLYQRLGVKPYDRKAHFSRASHSPRSVTIPLRPSIGTAATATVTEGAAVRKGDCIGFVPDDKLGCPVHASIDGTVKAIDERGIHISSQ